MTIIDADVLPTRHRHEQLDQALQDAGLEKRSANEWICLLVTEPVDEERDYKRPAKTTEECKEAARKLAETDPLEAALAEFPPSLQQGWEELERTF